jgi:single-stranded-DNA-specific exonuclease
LPPHVRIQRRPLPDGLDTLPQHLHPVLRRVYRNRRVSGPEELERSLKGLHPFSALHGIRAAVDLLEDALRRRQRILVVGDFDADGATSCAVAVRALTGLGAAEVRYLVPDRFVYGYGLTPGIVEVAAEREPELLITVDNGISSLEGVQAARDRGMRVLVTDHHLPGARLPAADAIVNPNQPGDGFPSKHLAGVGVIFYVLSALRARLRESGWFGPSRPEPNLADLLDLVALGTVADVVPLDHTNRVLVSQGLARIRAGRACPGVRALAEVAGRPLERLSSADLGFYLAPRLNAAGRLDDMSVGIACLLAEDDGARVIAAELDRLNRERREIEAHMQEQALAALEGLALEGRADLPWGLTLFDPEWHQGVVGLLASRIKERLHRPVIAFAPGGEGEVKGSARSIPGLHVRDTLDAVAAAHPGLITRFGGHAMAAGLSLPTGSLDAFEQAFDAEVRRRLSAEDLQGIVLSDGELAPDDFGLELAEALRAGGPWGQGFPEPLFDNVFEVINARVVGGRHLKLQLRLPRTQLHLDAIAFNTPEDQLPASGQLRAAYCLEVNEFRGTLAPQLRVRHMEPV